MGHYNFGNSTQINKEFTLRSSHRPANATCSCQSPGAPVPHTEHSSHLEHAALRQPTEHQTQHSQQTAAWPGCGQGQDTILPWHVWDSGLDSCYCEKEMERALARMVASLILATDCISACTQHWCDCKINLKHLHRKRQGVAANILHLDIFLMNSSTHPPPMGS